MKRCPAYSRSFNDSQSFCLEDGTLLVPDSQTNPPLSSLSTPKKIRAPIIFGFPVGDDYDLSVKFRNVPLTADK